MTRQLLHETLKDIFLCAREKKYRQDWFLLYKYYKTRLRWINADAPRGAFVVNAAIHFTNREVCHLWALWEIIMMAKKIKHRSLSQKLGQGQGQNGVGWCECVERDHKKHQCKYQSFVGNSRELNCSMRNDGKKG